MNTAKELFTKVLSRTADSTKSKPGLFGLLSDNSITLKNLLFSAVVVGLELLLSSTVFDCPLNNHVLYGVMFLVAPFVIVLIMNVLLVGNPWDITDRCFIRRYRRRRKDDENRKCCRSAVECLSGECCYWVLPNVAKAFVGPCFWLIASFADTKYFVCAAVGQDIEKRNLTNVTEIKELEAQFADAKAWSHISAWIVFLVLVVGTAIVMTTKKCCLKDNVLLEDEYILDRREAIAALVTFRHYIEHPSEHGDDGEGDVKKNLPPVPSRSPDASRAVTGVSVSSSSASRAAGSESNSDSTTITIESGGTAGEGKKEDKKKEEKKKVEKKNDGITTTGPGTSAGDTDMGVSAAPVAAPIASSAEAIVPVTSPIVEAGTSSAVTPSVSAPTTSAIGDDKKEGKKKEEKKKNGIIGWFKKTLGIGQDEEKDEDGEQGIVGSFMGNEEKITLYPEGIPEQQGKKWVEGLFQGWSKGDWNHRKAYRDFQKRYPRVTSGRPWDAWVIKENSDDNHIDGTQEGTPNKRGHQYSRIKGKITEATSSV